MEQIISDYLKTTVPMSILRNGLLKRFVFLFIISAWLLLYLGALQQYIQEIGISVVLYTCSALYSTSFISHHQRQPLGNDHTYVRYILFWGGDDGQSPKRSCLITFRSKELKSCHILIFHPQMAIRQSVHTYVAVETDTAAY